MCVMAQLSGKCHISVSISTKNRDFVKSLEQYEDEISMNIPFLWLLPKIIGSE